MPVESADTAGGSCSQGGCSSSNRQGDACAARGSDVGYGWPGEDGGFREFGQKSESCRLQNPVGVCGGRRSCWPAAGDEMGGARDYILIIHLCHEYLEALLDFFSILDKHNSSF